MQSTSTGRSGQNVELSNSSIRFSQRCNWKSRSLWDVTFHVLNPWEWRQPLPSKRQEPAAQSSSVTGQKTKILKVSVTTKYCTTRLRARTRHLAALSRTISTIAPAGRICRGDWKYKRTPASKPQILSVRTYEKSDVREKYRNKRCIISSHFGYVKHYGWKS